MPEGCTNRRTGSCPYRHTHTDDGGLQVRSQQLSKVQQAVLVRELEEDTIEVPLEDGDDTRALVGAGYELKEILFPGEFVTLHIRKLPQSCTKEDIIRFVADSDRGSGSGSNLEPVRVTLTQYPSGSEATLKFTSKDKANAAFNLVKGKLLHGSTIEFYKPEPAKATVTPRGIRQSESCRLTVSWATSRSVGKALVTFQTPQDANHVIDNVADLFPHGRVTVVHGELRPTWTTDQARTPHLVVAAVKPKVLHFDLRQPWPADESSPGFTVTIINLKKNVDEVAIRKVLGRIPIVASRITVMCANPQAGAPVQQGNIAILQREKFLAPLAPFITANSTTTEFFSKTRAGVHILFEHPTLAPRAYLATCPTYSRMDLFNGLPIRLEREFTQWASIHVDLYNFFQAEVEEVNQYARRRGVITCNKPTTKDITEGGSKFVSLWYKCPNKELIATIQARLEQALVYRGFQHRDRDLLFTWTGRNIVKKLSLNDQASIYWDPKTHTVLIYGKKEVQEVIQQQLVNVIEQIKKFEQVDKLFVLSVQSEEIDLATVVNRATIICQAQAAAYYHVVKNRLYVTGTSDTCNRIEAELDRHHLLRPTHLKLDSTKGECGLCFCDLDRNFLTTSICGHQFCTECLQLMFETAPPPPPPIKCPYNECERRLPIQDIIKFAATDAIQTVLDYAVATYRIAHPELVSLCPKPGCNQLLPTSTPSLPTHRKNASVSSLRIRCFAFQVTYCLMCTEQTGKATKVHPGESCTQSQRGPSQATLVHLNHIRENILNFKCPRCKMVVWEFDGCCAVTCKCGCGFCGICFEDCGKDAHPHVAGCLRNPKRGQLFLMAADLKQAHNASRMANMRSYIGTINDSEVLANVRKYLSKDVTDLGMDPTEIFGV